MAHKKPIEDNLHDIHKKLFNIYRIDHVFISKKDFKKYRLITYNDHQIVLEPLGTKKRKYYSIYVIDKLFVYTKQGIRKLKIERLLND